MGSTTVQLRMYKMHGTSVQYIDEESGMRIYIPKTVLERVASHAPFRLELEMKEKTA